MNLNFEQIAVTDGRRRKVACVATKRGFTLLELILALGLTVIVGAMVTTSIRVYMVQLNRQQNAVEREAVAKATLNMIANDIRAALQYKATDFSGLQVLQQTIALQSGAITEEEIEDEEDGDLVGEEEVVAFRPSFIGGVNSIRVDISRLPRLDQYNPLITSQAQQRTPSDIRAVSYFFSSQPGAVDDALALAQASVPGGLYRRSVDRAVANFRGEESIVASPDEDAQLVAGEVAAVSFRYFDGESWNSTWDSEDQGGFPTAVEIRVTVDPLRSGNPETFQASSRSQEELIQHVLTVHLPMAEPVEEQ